MVLDAQHRQIIDKAWDTAWSSGITNPIVVTDLLGTVLMVGALEDSGTWNRLAAAAQAGEAAAIGSTLGLVRRGHGIEPGSEIEAGEFWRDSRVLGRLMDLMGQVVRTSAGTDVLGDLYEHVLAKLGTAGQFGQFRTPRHIVQFMVDLVDPRDGEVVVDPACGSASFLVEASAHRKRHGREGSYLGVEIDRTVARIAEANLVFHGIDAGAVRISDGLTVRDLVADVVLANPPFSGAVEPSVAALYHVKTAKTELLFVEAIVDRLREGGRAAVVVPFGVITGAGLAAREIRELLVKGNHLRAVIELPSGVFRPYTDVKTAILVWDAHCPPGATVMVRVEHDGFTMDQRRQPTDANDLPEILGILRGTKSNVPHITVGLPEIAAQRFNLNPSRYLQGDSTERSTSAITMEESLQQLSTTVDQLTKELDTMMKLAVRA